MTRIRYATAEDDAEDVPPEERCIWPGCTRRRAPGRAGGSGRQKEYCEKADRPGTHGTGRGGGPEHNARSRWAARERALRAAPGAATSQGEAVPPAAAPQGSLAARDDSLATPAAIAPGEPGGDGPDAAPWTYAKLHATELLGRARRQHAAALEALTTERDLYARLAGQLQVLADPAALDLEIAAVTLRAGREVSQAAEDAARARQAQLTAQRERDEAIAGRRDAEALAASRTAELDAERDRLLREALDAGLRADAAVEQAADARQDADQARQDAGQATREAGQARQEAERVKDAAARQVAEAAARADAAAVRADEAVRREQERATAERARADAHAQRAAEQVASAAAAADKARDEAGAARAQRDTARVEAGALRFELTALRAEATASAERAAQQSATLRADISRLREEARQSRQDADRARAERDRDLARLEAAHRDAINAERARAVRAEGELDSLRAAQRKAP